MILGQKTVYVETYTPELLYPVPRLLARDKIKMSKTLPFHGVDIWNGFELSWLNPKGKPIIAMALLTFPCTTPNIVESKSLKLYINSFNQSHFASFEEVRKTMQTDLSKACQGAVEVELFEPSQLKNKTLEGMPGLCLDAQDLTIDSYQVNPSLLKTSADQAEETLYSDLLKSNCLATGQPDWGSLLIRYKGKKIDHAALLRYIISFRTHSGFAEHCVEQIFNDLMTQCQPEKLTVYARYTRRGGLDINPFRSNFESCSFNERQYRQ